jgi:hypothetical protein
MKHLTLIPNSNQVYFDGFGLQVDLSDMDQAIHVVQWSETNQYGEIEFVNDPYAPQDQYKPNQGITSCEPYQKYIDAWHVAKQKWDAEQEEMARRMKMMQELLNAQTPTG